MIAHIWSHDRSLGNRIRRTACTAFAFAALFSLASCGSTGEPLSSVSGKVLVSGKPAAGAVVMFVPEQSDPKHIPATATTGEDGSFTMTSGDKVGAKVGKYIVTVVWPDPAKKPTDSQKMMGASQYDAPDVLKGRYATREISKLRAEVKAGQNNLEPFDLK